MLSFGAIARRLFASPEKGPPSETDEDEIEQPADQIIEEVWRSFPYIEAPPAPEPTAKRSLEQVSDAETLTEDEENPHKRRKTRAKGKRQLVAPRMSDGQTLEVPLRALPENVPTSKPRKSPGRMPAKKPQRKLEGRVARSRKTASPVTESHANGRDSTPDEPPRRRSPRKSTTRGSAGEGPLRVPVIGPLDYEEGITEILMSPSPIKVARPNSDSNAQTRKKAQSKSGPFLTGYESLSDGEEDDLVEDGVEEEENNHPTVARKQRENSIGSTELHGMVIDADLLDSLITKARRVGHTAKRGTRDFKDVSSVNKLITQGGEKIHRRLDKLVKDYEKLQSSKSAGDEEAANQTRENIATNLQLLTDYATRIVTVKLNGKASEDMVMKLLRDLYFYVLPNWLDCIKLASECYDEESSMTTLSLEQMHTHLKSWCQLAESAISQPTAIQPKGGYQTSKPTREILPQIHKLRRTFQSKISNKSDTSSVARALKLRIEQEKQNLGELEEEDEQGSTSDEEVERLKLELAKVRREKEQRAERAKRARINEIHRIQAEQIRQALEWQREVDSRAEKRVRRKLQGSMRGRSKSREASWGKYVVDFITREEEDDPDPFGDDYQPRITGRTASVNLGEDVDAVDEDGGYEDEYQLERVEVFPHNNTSGTTAIPWSNGQKVVFVNCMIQGGMYPLPPFPPSPLTYTFSPLLTYTDP